MTPETMRRRTARCACGALTLTTRGEPAEVYLCSCLDCQRRSGAAFSYAALYPTSAVEIAGPQKTWRHTAESGRWVETAFCPTCGVSLSSRTQAFPDFVCVAVGGFADPDFAKPERQYRASRRHHWVALDDVELIDSQ